jgi:hypothetical protein
MWEEEGRGLLAAAVCDLVIMRDIERRGVVVAMDGGRDELAEVDWSMGFVDGSGGQG